MGNTVSDLQFDGDVRTTLQTLEDQVKKDAKGVVADLGAVGLKASIYDAQDVITYFTQFLSGEVDDRDMRQEKLMSWLFKLPLTPKSAFGSTLERLVINSLWTSLPHPYPSWSHMPGPQYRSADGSGNNPDQPSVGIAGGHYIRDVPVPRTLSAPRQLPDPEVVFEKLFKRRTADEGGFRAHPCGTSAHMFYFATLVTHDLFNTDATNRFHNTTTGYVDLAWLYGWNQDMQDSVRDKAGGRGKLYPDVFADARMGVQPPGLVAWALLWNRNHNWIAEQLLIHGKDDARFATIPSASDAEGTKLLDEHLFQTARLINGNTFVTAVLKDYVKQLLGVNREKTAWTLPIAADFSSPAEANIPEATGNQCSIEFNFIYRWHSALSQEDERWVNGLFQKLGSKKLAEELGEDQKDAVPTSDLTREHHSRREQSDPRTRIYFPLDPDVRRDVKTQKFPDSALAGFINQATSYHAGAFGGRQVPAIFKSIEIDGIRHGRELGTCTLNELRRLCHLRPYRSFLEMNADPTISASLRSLYGHPDNVELYPGLVAEQAKARQSGTGLCAGRTITYAILADAVALVRGDRFLTREWNEGNLTRWGFAETQADNNNLSFGNVLGDKLLNRHLGDELMPRDSVKTQYSFSVPEESIANVKAFGMGNLFRETRGEQNGNGEAKLHTNGEGSW